MLLLERTFDPSIGRVICSPGGGVEIVPSLLKFAVRVQQPHVCDAQATDSTFDATVWVRIWKSRPTVPGRAPVAPTQLLDGALGRTVIETDATSSFVVVIAIPVVVPTRGKADTR